MFRVVDQSYGVKRCTDHQDPSTGLNNLGERRAIAVSVLKRMVSGDPLHTCADCHNASVGMIAAQSAWLSAHCFVEDAVVACSVRNSLVEYRDFEFVGICEEGLKINVRD